MGIRRWGCDPTYRIRFVPCLSREEMGNSLAMDGNLTTNGLKSWIFPLPILLVIRLP